MVVFSFKTTLNKKTICCSEEDQYHNLDRDHKDSTDPNKITTAITTTTSLTVWRKSLLLSCEGFTVIGSDGSLVFRVDSYTGRGGGGRSRPSQVVLMDGGGIPILTMLRRNKKLGLVDNWLVFEGEVDDCSSSKKMNKKPIFRVRKSLNFSQSGLNVLAYVYRGMSEKSYAYVIEGSYAIRSCKVLDESRNVVAEIKRKEANIGGVSFGVEVFILVVQPRAGFDAGFAMALVLLLDQMFS